MSDCDNKINLNIDVDPDIFKTYEMYVKLRFKRNFPHSADEYEKSLLVSNSAHTVNHSAQWSSEGGL